MHDDEKDQKINQPTAGSPVEHGADGALNHVFRYHSPNPEQIPKYQAIRDKALELAEVIQRECPASPDRTTAYRAIREAVMWANASIACDGISPR